MHQIYKFIRRLKARYYIVAFLVLVAVAITPGQIKSAFELRQYMAYGGECLIIPGAIVLAIIFLIEMDNHDKTKRARRYDLDKRR